MKFPKIKISKGYLVLFHNENTKASFKFFHQVGLPVTAEIKALQSMINLRKKPSEYKMSTSREINISITF